MIFHSEIWENEDIDYYLTRQVLDLPADNINKIILQYNQDYINSADGSIREDERNQANGFFHNICTPHCPAPYYYAHEQEWLRTKLGQKWLEMKT